MAATVYPSRHEARAPRRRKDDGLRPSKLARALATNGGVASNSGFADVIVQSSTRPDGLCSPRRARLRPLGHGRQRRHPARRVTRGGAFIADRRPTADVAGDLWLSPLALTPELLLNALPDLVSVAGMLGRTLGPGGSDPLLRCRLATGRQFRVIRPHAGLALGRIGDHCGAQSFGV